MVWDDLVWVHFHAMNTAHNNPSFLPWHRLFVKVFDATLRKECSYEGNMPYWDWALDSQAPEKSPVFDDTFGFGGNGNGKCLSSGIFKFTNGSIPYHHWYSNN